MDGRKSLKEAVYLASSVSLTPKHAGERKLTPKKLLDQMPPSSDRDFVAAVLSKTTYVPWNEVVADLEKAIDSLLQTVKGNFYISVNLEKFSSELLFTCLFWNKIQDRVIDLVKVDENLPLNCTVVLIDDFIITGASLLSVVDDFQYETGRLDVSFHFCVARKSANDTCHKQFPGITVHNGGTFRWIHLPQMHYTTLHSSEIDSTIALYTDHKISNIMCNTPYLYHYGQIPGYDVGCLITYPPDEEIKIRLREQFFQGLIAPPKMFQYKIW